MVEDESKFKRKSKLASSRKSLLKYEENAQVSNSSSNSHLNLNSCNTNTSTNTNTNTTLMANSTTNSSSLYPTQHSQPQTYLSHTPSSSQSSTESSSLKKKPSHRHSKSNNSLSNSSNHNRSSSRGSIHEKSFFKFFKKKDDQSSSLSSPISPVMVSSSAASHLSVSSGTLHSNQHHQLLHQNLPPPASPQLPTLAPPQPPLQLTPLHACTPSSSSTSTSISTSTLASGPASAPPLPSAFSNQQFKKQNFTFPINSSSGSSLSLNSKKFSVKKRDWDWDGKSGSFEKLGPVGPGPKVKGGTIRVSTKSIIHAPPLPPSQIKSEPVKIENSQNKINTVAKSNLDIIDPIYQPKPDAIKNSVNQFVLITMNQIDWKLISLPKLKLDLAQFKSCIKKSFQVDVDDIILSLTDFPPNSTIPKPLPDSELVKLLPHLSAFKFYLHKPPKPRSKTISNSNSNPNSKHFYLQLPSVQHHQQSPRQFEESCSSINSSFSTDSIDEKFLSTPNHLIQVKKDSSIDYLNFKEYMDRRPSITRARSVTHSSIVVKPSPPQAPAASLQIQTEASRSETSNGSQIESSFKLIKPIEPMMDFDNPRSSPFRARANRKPPSIPFSSGSLSSTERKEFSRPTMATIGRSNTETSLFSMKSKENVDPWQETKINFNDFDDSSLDGSCNSDDNNELFVKKPKISAKEAKLTNNENEGEGGSENSKSLASSLIISKEEDDGASSSSSSSSEDESNGFGLFAKKPKIKLQLQPPAVLSQEKKSPFEQSSDEDYNEDFSENQDKVIHDNFQSRKMKSIYDTSTNKNKPVLNRLLTNIEIRPTVDVLYNNLEIFFPQEDLDTLIIEDDSSDQVIVNDKKIVGTNSNIDNDKSFKRMKSIRIIAKEAHMPKRNQNEQTINEIEIKHKDKNDNDVANYHSKLSASSSSFNSTNSILRRKSTKLWGQKSIQISTNSSNKNPTKIKPNQFIWIKGALIGIGKFGKVYVGMNITSGELIAVKQMNFVNSTFKTEINNLKDLDHVNIVQYLGFEILNKEYKIFLEYVSGGSIGHILRQFGKFDEKLIKFLSIQMFKGLAYIHNKNILHCDLKADNLLLEVDGTLKISDFGISQKSKNINSKDYHQSFKGTIFWMAPEIINNNSNSSGYNVKIDIWSAGCVLVEMVTGDRPWSNFESEAVLYKLGKEGGRPPIPRFIRSSLSAQFKNILNACFDEPNFRPMADQLLQLDFYKNNDAENSLIFENSGLAPWMRNVVEKERIKGRMQSMVRKL